MKTISMLLVFLACFLASTASAKGWDSTTISKLIAQGEIDKVIDYYKTAYASPDRDPRDAIRIADLYTQKKEYATAVSWYEKEKAYWRESKTNMLNMARAYRMTGNYQQALDGYLMYVAETGDVASVMDEANLCERLIRANAFTDHFYFEPYQFNSEKDEAQLAVVRGNLSYTVHAAGQPGRPWAAIRQYNGWLDPVPLLSKPDATADYHHLAFMRDGNQCIYTLKEAAPVKNTTPTVFRLYLATYLGGALINPQPFPYNGSAYSCLEAVFSADGQQLYFASDMPGGFGGYDIWMCSLENGTWSKPQNPGKRINTSANEKAPFFTIDDGKPLLFFASDRDGGFGGSDIYKATFANNGWQGAEMLPAPVNAVGDENSYVFDPESRAGYVSSNRDNGKGGADIYRIRPLDLRLVISTRDSLSKAPVDFAFLQVYDNNTLVGETVTGSDGLSISPLGLNRNYTLTVSKDNYRPRTVSFSTAGKSNGDSVCLNLYLLEDPKYSLKNSSTGISMQNYIVFMGKFSDAAGKTIRPDMRMVNLNTNKLRILDIDDQGAFRIKLMTNNNYKIFIEHQGHKLSEEITTYGLDHGSLKLKNYILTGDKYKTGENRVLQPFQVPDSLRYLWLQQPVAPPENSMVLSTSLPKDPKAANSVPNTKPAPQTTGTNSLPANTTSVPAPENTTDIYYKIQIGSYGVPTRFPGLESYGQLEESVAYGNHIYRIGNFSDIQNVKNKLEQIRQQGYTLAFILQYRDNKVINIIK